MCFTFVLRLWLGFLVYSGLDILELMTNARKTLRVPDKQSPSGRQLLPEPSDQALLRWLIEVAHHVSAEDHVKQPLHGPWVHQVQAGEMHHPTQGGVYAVDLAAM